jgi:hypothetical protein
MVTALLLPCRQLQRPKLFRRWLIVCVAWAIVLLLSVQLNLNFQLRVCNIRDWEFVSSIFTSPKLISRGPILLHSSNGSCTITWESYSRTSLHFTHPKQLAFSHFSSASIWLKHNMGLMEVPFGCAWNVCAYCTHFIISYSSLPGLPPSA